MSEPKIEERIADFFADRDNIEEWDGAVACIKLLIAPLVEEARWRRELGDTTTRKVIAARSERDALKAELRDAHELTAEVLRERDALKERLRGAQLEADGARHNNNALVKENGELKERLREAEEDDTVVVAALKEKCDTLTESLEHAEKTIEALKIELGRME